MCCKWVDPAHGCHMFWNPCGLDSDQIDFSAWGFQLHPTEGRISCCCGAQKVPEHSEVPLSLININTIKAPLQQCLQRELEITAVYTLLFCRLLSWYISVSWNFTKIHVWSADFLQTNCGLMSSAEVGAWPVQKCQHWLLHAKWDLKYRGLEGSNFVLCGLSVLIIRILLWFSSFFHNTLLWWLPTLLLQRWSAASYPDNEEGQGEGGGRLPTTNVKHVPVRQ